VSGPGQTGIEPGNPVTRIEEPVQPIVAPPRRLVGPVGWARENLFSSPLNIVLTLLAVGILAWIIPTLVEWALVKAWWVAPAQTCRDNLDGACWSVVAHRHRLIFFGIYPYDEHWRPLIAMAIMLGMICISAMRRFWTMWLLPAWIVGLAVQGLLMWGGIFGMTFVPNENWGGLPLTILLSVFSIALAFPLSILLALGRQSDMPAIKAICVGFIELIRGVPLVSVLFMASVMFPLFLPEGVTIDKLLRALVGMTLFTAAYLAEAIRGGLQAIPRGQYEAAEATGLSYWQKTFFIILPQALRLVIPPIVNQVIACFKDTSLVTIVGLYDFLTAAKVALADPEWRPFFIEAYAFAALIYWAFCFIMSRYSQKLEHDLNLGTRRG
jgi:general L-amino acid transport system permease protein